MSWYECVNVLDLNLFIQEPTTTSNWQSLREGENEIAAVLITGMSNQLF